MTYRNDRDADQARIAALEAELAGARTRIAELEGKQATALVRTSGGALTASGRASSPAARWLGAPLELLLTRTFDGSFPTDAFETLIEVIREVTRDRGRSELLRSSFAWTSSSRGKSIGPFLQVEVTIKDGVTRLTVSDRLGQLAGVVYGGLGGGVGGGAIIAPIGASLALPVLAPVFVLGWLGGMYALSRAVYRRSARRRAETVQRLFDAVERAISAAIA